MGRRTRKGQSFRFDRGLTERETRFVDAFVGSADGEVPRAAALAGINRATGYKMVRRPNVAQAILQRRAARSEAVDIDDAQVCRELAHVAFSSIRDLFELDGSMKPVQLWPEDIARAVASIEVTRDLVTIERNGHTSTMTRQRVTKIRLWPKVQALELLARKLGMLRDVPATFDHAGYLEEVWRRIQAEGGLKALPAGGDAGGPQGETRAS